MGEGSGIDNSANLLDPTVVFSSLVCSTDQRGSEESDLRYHTPLNTGFSHHELSNSWSSSIVQRHTICHEGFSSLSCTPSHLGHSPKCSLSLVSTDQPNEHFFQRDWHFNAHLLTSFRLPLFSPMRSLFSLPSERNIRPSEKDDSSVFVLNSLERKERKRKGGRLLNIATFVSTTSGSS